MGHHIDGTGRFQSDLYPDLPPDKIILGFKHSEAWPALAVLAEGYQKRDAELAADIRERLRTMRADKLAVLDPDAALRLLLRGVFSAIDAIAEVCTIENGWAPQDIAIDGAREEIFDAFADDLVGKCENCAKVIFPGDLGHRCRGDDPVLMCADCAYTWGEVYDQWANGQAETEDANERACFMKRFQAHIDGGGSRDDKMTWALE